MNTLLLFSKPVLRKGIGASFILSIQHIVPAFIILNFLIGCGNGKSGKIRLHARDSADVAVSGTWLAAEQVKRDTAASDTADSVAGFILNEDHSAVLFKKDSNSIKKVKAQWIWNKTKAQPAPAETNEKRAGRTSLILIVRKTAGDSTVLLSLATAQRNGETVLNTSSQSCFKKEK